MKYKKNIFKTNKLSIAILAGLSIFNTCLASIKDRRDMYITLTGAGGWQNDTNVDVFLENEFLSLLSEGEPINYNTVNVDVKYDTVAAIRLAAGKYVTNWFRLELESSYRHNFTEVVFIQHPCDYTNTTYKIGQLHSGNIALMLNAYFDIPLAQDFTCKRFGTLIDFYLGAGAGIGFFYGSDILVNLDLDQWPDVNYNIQLKNKFKYLDTVPTWQLMSGFNIMIDEHWDLILGYRLFHAIKPILAIVDSVEVIEKNPHYTNTIEVGLRYAF